MRILIFGGDGRLGTALRVAYATQYELIAPARAEVEWTGAGIASQVDQYRPDFVLNATGYTNVPLAEGEGKTLAYWLNEEVPKFMAEACAKHNTPFLHFSTDYVFAGDKLAGYVETDITGPVNVYGASKLAGELAVLLAHAPNSYIVRTSRLYGDPASAPDSKKSFVEIMVEQLTTKATLEVDDLDFSSPTLVSELVAHVAKHILDVRVTPGIYHMTNLGGTTWLGWATEIRNILALPTVITARDQTGVVRPLVRPPYTLLLSTKLPSMSPWQEALRQHLAYERQD